MELEEINTSIRKPNNNFAEEIFENQNYQIEFLREKIKLLDTTQYKIEGTSLEIINQIYQKPELLKNIIRMISEELKKDYLERIPFLYLMSDILLWIIIGLIIGGIVGLIAENLEKKG